MDLVQKGINKFGKLIVASFFVMGIGLIAFLLTPLFYGLWGIDTDLPGILIADIGLVLFIVGWIRYIKPRRFALVAFSILASLLSLPVLFLIVSLVYYLITRKPLG
jgi:hypothetical protein